jgi:SAM-dependent methyltransferase
MTMAGARSEPVPAPGAERPAACWCGTTDLRPFSPGYLACPRCHTLVARRFPAGDVARLAGREEGIYGRDYHRERLPREYGFPDLATRARDELGERCLHWLRALLRYRLPPARVLELGSAHGGFVALLRQAGFDASGLELSPWVAEFATRTFDVPMHVGPVEDQAIAPGSLDAIALMDVLEHLTDPAGTIRHCLGLLGPDGLLLVQTPCLPDGRTYEEMVASGDPFVEHLKDEEHLYLFGREGLCELLRRQGAPYVAFEPAIFAHYDMFLAASPRPLATVAPAAIEAALLATPGGRVVRTLLALDDERRGLRAEAAGAEAERRRLEGALGEAERDRAARVAVIETQGAETARLHAQLDRWLAENKALWQRALDAEIAAYALEGRLRALAGRTEARERGFAEVAATVRGARAYRVLRRLGRWNALAERLAVLGAAPAPLPEAAPEAARALGPEHVAHLIGRDWAESRDLFPLWESHGFHVTPVHFYSPIPEVGALGEEPWRTPSALPGLEMNEAAQLAFLETVCPRFRAEYEAFPAGPTGVPHEFHLGQMMFRAVDAEVLHCMVRHHRPRRILEVGSGYSTYVTAAAVRRNAEEGRDGELIAVEPHPSPVLRAGVPGLARLVGQPVERADPALFSALADGDVLFIDSSHVVRIDSDVRFLVLEVLPRLRPGVLVHVHDVFLPFEYPRDWVVAEHRFWTEQYLLQAFLAFNRAFEVLWASSWMHHRHPDRLRAAFSHYDPAAVWPGSFWIRRVR